MKRNLHRCDLNKKKKKPSENLDRYITGFAVFANRVLFHEIMSECVTCNQLTPNALKSFLRLVLEASQKIISTPSRSKTRKMTRSRVNRRQTDGKIYGESRRYFSQDGRA
ncbi:hypothetical protein PUN28_000064 [Cardiocondyla obscurior]|uniref:Uncharacterized protein n=1 Tax=Cardiocondyla obscurior TaxID=286306 RepID=A0AAW2GXZ3_9HYME